MKTGRYLFIAMLLPALVSSVHAAPPDEPKEEPKITDVQPAPVMPGTNMWDLTRDGDVADQPIAIPGFGPLALVASSFTLESPGTTTWQEKDGSRVLSIGSFTAELRTVPPEWKAVRSLFPPLKPGDDLRVRKIMWTGISAWMIDLTLAPEAHPASIPTRHRYLVAPLETGFLILSFRGTPDRFEQDRPALRGVALSVRFHVNGLIAEYCNSTTLECLSALQVDSCIDFDWGTGGPTNGVGPDCFSVRWTGKLKPLYSEVYTFTTLSDDGVRLWVNGDPLVDNWTIHPATEDMGSIKLKAGEEVSIRMEWYDNMVHAAARLLWQSTSQTREPVSASCLSASPAPGFAPPPARGGGRVEAPSDWPVLLYSELPGGYKVTDSAGLQWKGERPSQTLLIGEGDKAVEVILKKVNVRPADARSLLPGAHPSDVFDVQKVAWRYAWDLPPATAQQSSEPASPVFTVRIPERYAWAWSVECTLDAASHPETKLLYRWYCLVPLKQGLLLFSFASQDKDWMQTHWDMYRTTFDSVTLTVEEQADANVEPEEAIF